MHEFGRLMGAGLDISEHLGLLRGLACDPHVKTIVEFGFRTGVSATALCTTGKPVTSYDIDRCALDVIKLSKMAPNFKFVQGSSLEVTIPECGLLFIDSLHTYKQLRQELSRHHSKAAKFIVMHDTEVFGHKGKDGSKPGLQEAIHDFLKGDGDGWIWDLHLINNNGLTVLRRR